MCQSQSECKSSLCQDPANSLPWQQGINIPVREQSDCVEVQVMFKLMMLFKVKKFLKNWSCISYHFRWWKYAQHPCWPNSPGDDPKLPPARPPPPPSAMVEKQAVLGREAAAVHPPPLFLATEPTLASLPRWRPGPLPTQDRWKPMPVSLWPTYSKISSSVLVNFLVLLILDS